MILHIVRCEMCDKEFTFDPITRHPGGFAPENWLTVFHMKEMQAQEGWHFCSFTCLQNWSITQAKKEYDANP